MLVAVVAVATVAALVANCCLSTFADLSLWSESNWCSMCLEPVPSCFEIDFEMTTTVICLAFLTHVLHFLLVVVAVVEFVAMEKWSWAMEANSCSI